MSTRILSRQLSENYMEQLAPKTLEKLGSSFALDNPRQVGESARGAHYVMYHLHADNGGFALLKPRPLSSKEAERTNLLAELRRANRIFLHLASHGFPVAAPILTKNGSTVATIDGQLYALYPYVQGRAMICTNLQQVAVAGESLASYHQIMEEFPRRMSCTEESFPDRFQDRVDDFSSNLAMMNGGASELGIEDSLDYFKESLLEIELSLLRLDYDDLPRLTIHGDYRRQNLLFQGDRLEAVIDFHRSRLEARTLDLAIALADILPRTDNWHALDLASKFIASYEKNQGLSHEERDALPVLIEARVAWRALRRIRRLARTRDGKKRIRRARKFEFYVDHLRSVRKLRPSWKGIFEGGDYS